MTPSHLIIFSMPPKEPPPPKKKCFIIAGPNVYYIPILQQALVMQGGEVVTIGDGKRKLTEKDWAQFLFLLKQYNNEDFLVYIAAKGCFFMKRHYLIHKDYDYVETLPYLKEIFKLASTRTSVDIIIDSSYAGMVNAKVKKIMPENVSLLSFASANERMTREKISEWLIQLTKKHYAPNYELSAEKLLILYLTKVSLTSAPSFDSALTHSTLENKLEKFSGRSFTEVERKRILERLLPFMEAEESQYISFVMQKIEENDCAQLNTYGKNLEMAICHVASDEFNLKCKKSVDTQSSTRSLTVPRSKL